jgi:peptide deformylase
LSVPGESYPTGRAKWARVTGLDAEGAPVTVEGEDLFARMLQHETGHLEGQLYLDRLLGRHARAAKRMLKTNGWTVPGLSWMPGKVADPFGHTDL